MINDQRCGLVSPAGIEHSDLPKRQVLLCQRLWWVAVFASSSWKTARPP